MQVQYLSWEDPLEEGMATCSNILAWGIPWTGEPQGCQESDTIEVTEHAHTCYVVGSQTDPRLANKMDYFVIRCTRAGVERPELQLE